MDKVNPAELLAATADIIKIYSQMLLDAKKYHPTDEAHRVATGCLTALLVSTNAKGV